MYLESLKYIEVHHLLIAKELADVREKAISIQHSANETAFAIRN